MAYAAFRFLIHTCLLATCLAETPEILGTRLGDLCPDSNCSSIANAACFEGHCVCEENYYSNATNDCNYNVPTRLIHPNSSFEGRVEVFFNNLWGAVYDSSPTAQNAEVVCRSMGLEGNVPKGRSYYGQGHGIFTVYAPVCTGMEGSLWECPLYGTQYPWGHAPSGASHVYEFGVNCSQAVRLRGGNTLAEGRVEVFHEGEWGTVCDDNFGVFDARVVCRALGFDKLDEVPQVWPEAYFGEGNGTIFLDDVMCLGSEQHLNQCRHDGWGKSDCGHSEDVGVVCSDGPLVRLVNGTNDTNPIEGRVEIYGPHGAWGTICDNDFDVRDARVVCSMLGFVSEIPMIRKGAFYGEGKGVVLISDLKCDGTETTLDQCSRKTHAEHDCTHRQDVGVICTDGNAVRLVNGSTPWQGRLEIRHGDSWGTVCDDDFGEEEATVVCRTLEFDSEGATAVHGAQFGEGEGPVWLDEVSCTGLESNVLDCRHLAWGQGDCNHSEDVGVICPEQRPIRLVNGSSSNEGRVEVFKDGTWGTICDEDFDENDAIVVCRMLQGEENREIESVEVLSGASYGEGRGHVFYSNLECRGTENDLDQCIHKLYDTHVCRHDRDVGVKCTFRGPEPVG